MRKIIIRIVGYGQEIVQGTFTDEEIEILEKKVEEEDHSLGYIISDIVDILPDSYDWYDRDDELHLYGASVDASTLLIMDGSKEIKIENIWELEDEPYNGEIDSEEVCNFNGETNIIEFDISKLKVYIKDIIFDGYENSLITTIFYNGEEIFCDPDTSGKSFESYLEKKKKNGKENTNT
jgi:hypothetical protein